MSQQCIGGVTARLGPCSYISLSFPAPTFLFRMLRFTTFYHSLQHFTTLSHPTFLYPFSYNISLPSPATFHYLFSCYISQLLSSTCTFHYFFRLLHFTISLCSYPSFNESLPFLFLHLTTFSPAKFHS